MLTDAPKRILVVDDETSMCYYISMLLSRDGYEVEVATSGVQALEKFESRKFDAVLTDFVMDPTNGEDLAKQIKQRCPGEPVVMVTGFPPRPPSASVDACIAKPFDVATLRHTLDAIFHPA